MAISWLTTKTGGLNFADQIGVQKAFFLSRKYGFEYFNYLIITIGSISFHCQVISQYIKVFEFDELIMQVVSKLNAHKKYYRSSII